MRVAIISDIHGNIPALESVLDDVRSRAVDRIICLGDLIGKGPSCKEAIDLCRRECDVVVQGNWDAFLYRDYNAMKQGGEIGNGAAWYIGHTGDERMEYLGSLSHYIEVDMDGRLVRMFHAHPHNFNRYHENSPLEKRQELFECYDCATQRRADVAVYADIHGAYMQVIDDYGILLNVGSVGNPLDMPQASYAVLESGTANFSVQFVRVKYDIERAVAMAVAAGVPDLEGYIQELRTAVYYRRG